MMMLPHRATAFALLPAILLAWVPPLAANENAADVSPLNPDRTRLFAYSKSSGFTATCAALGWERAKQHEIQKGVTVRPGSYEIMFQHEGNKITKGVRLESGKIYALLVDFHQNRVKFFASDFECYDLEPPDLPRVIDPEESRKRTERSPYQDVLPSPQHAEKPEYPDLYREWGIHGRVHIKALVAANGTVQRGCVMESSHPFLDPLAKKAVAKYVFEPGLKDGVPVPVWVVVPFVFRMR